MNLAVVRETRPGETRVALVPDSAKRLMEAGVTVTVECGAGEAAGASDAAYEAAGAKTEASREAILSSADLLACVNRPEPGDLAHLKPGAAVVGFLRPLDEPEPQRLLAERGLTAFAMELIPRITRAQAMDALSSQATVQGYKAAVLAAERLPRMFPLLMTAAGTVAPARALILGAGVAGLQAIATTRRLGAVVQAYDVRAAAADDVRSLGATFLVVDLGGIDTQDTGGYARELTEEALERGRALIAEHARTADVVITTALVPGRPAPLLLTKEAVAGMKRGSVVVDLGAPSGGNCALSRPGERFVFEGVEILAPLNLAASVPVHASQLYSNNVSAFVKLLIRDGALHVDLEDSVAGPACVAHEGKIVNPRVQALLTAAP